MKKAAGVLAAQSPNTYACVSCICPCFLLGNITTKLHRERPFPCFDYEICYDCQLGVRGCTTCCWSCLGASLLWPASPLLSCYLGRERWKLKLFYKDDERLKPATWRQTLFWPTNLRDQHRFVSDTLAAQELIFAWDLDQYKDMLESRPDYTSYTMMIFGPDSRDETEFIRKLMVQTDPLQVADVEMQEVEGIPKIRTATKPLPTADGSIRMLELWRIPPVKHRSGALRSILSDASIVLFLLDLNSPQTLETVKETYLYQSDFLKCSKLILILKLRADKNPSSDDLESMELKLQAEKQEQETIAWARKTTSVWFLISVDTEADLIKLSREMNKLLAKEEGKSTRASADFGGGSASSQRSLRLGPLQTSPTGNHSDRVGEWTRSPNHAASEDENLLERARPG